MRPLFLILFVFLTSCSIAQDIIIDKRYQLLGVNFDISVVYSDSSKAIQYIHSAVEEVKRIEACISSWKSDSQTSEINRQAGKSAVNVDPILFDLIQRAIRVSTLTNEAFDITVGPLLNVWKFDGSMTSLPSNKQLSTQLKLIGSDQITLDTKNHSVMLQQAGMSIGFGAIGKGFIAEHIKQFLQKQGIQGGLIGAGGDLVFWGNHPKTEQWKIAIANPNGGEPLCWLELSDNAVVTSGDYEKFVTIDGKKYAHIIDPRTGMPAEGLKSVTVICPNAELADALATATFVLGPQKGLELLNQLKGVEGILITSSDELLTTEDIQLNYY